MPQMTKPRPGVLVTSQQHVSYCEVFTAARTSGFPLVTQKVSMRGESMPNAESAENNFLLSIPARARPPRFKGRLDHPELVPCFCIPLTLPLVMHEKADGGVEIPSR